MRGTTALRTMITKICRNVFQNLFLSESSRNEIKIFFNKISHHMMSKSREGPNKTKFPQSKHQHSWQLCEQGTMQNKSLFSKRAAFSPLHFMSVQYSHYVPGGIMVNGSPKKKNQQSSLMHIQEGVQCAQKSIFVQSDCDTQ